jgi:hypothetical protein
MQPKDPGVKRYVRRMAVVGFGPKMAWLAVRHDDPAVVAKALDLRDLGEVEARAGLDLAHFTDDRVVMFAVRPWVVVAGRWLFGLPSVAGLSAALGTEVQYFATHRGLLTHRWERAVEGDLLDVFRHDEDSDEDELVDENDVFRVAARWSVDPRALPITSLHIAAIPIN